MSSVAGPYLFQGLRGAHIGGRSDIIGVRSIIAPDAVLKDVILMGADYYDTEFGRSKEGAPRIGIGRGSQIRDAIIDKNARIGAQVKLLNETGVENFDAPDGSYYIRDRIIIVPKNGLIADGTVV